MPRLKTERNILKAYRQESHIKWIYRTFAQRADKGGDHDIARLFRAVAASEDIHSHLLLRCLLETSVMTKQVVFPGLYDDRAFSESTETNLRNAISENDGLSAIYPEMIRDAYEDGWLFTRECFIYGQQVSQVYDHLFRKALDELITDKAIFHVCQSCGNTIDIPPSGACRICGSSNNAFTTVE